MYISFSLIQWITVGFRSSGKIRITNHRGIPYASSNLRSRRTGFSKNEGTPVRYNLEIPFSMYVNYCIQFMRWKALRRELSSRFVPRRPELSEMQSERIGTE